MDNILKLNNIYYKYNKKTECISDLSFEIKRGTFHAFIGENGAGKSTTIKMIVGLINDYEGDIMINDENVKENNVRNIISYIPDKAIFPHNMNVQQYLIQCGLLKRGNKSQIIKEIQEWSENLDITNLLKNNANHLSAGQKKKILLMRAIIEQSELIILDEPGANLDPTTREILFKTLLFLVKKGITIFISTHILDEIKNYANHATFIKSGKLIWSGKVSGEQIKKIYKEHYIKI